MGDTNSQNENNNKLPWGELKFNGDDVKNGKNSKFVRVEHVDDFNELNKKLYKLMIDEWNFKPPELIISMNGGAKHMKPLNKDQKLAFRRGLIEISKATSTWIITGGFHEGVVKLVGETTKDYSNSSEKLPLTVIGVGTWNSVYKQVEFLKFSNKTTYTIPHRNHKYDKGTASLDPYHDGFILFDDCSGEKKFGKEIYFRTQFEKYVSTEADRSIVQFIVEGGKSTIETGAKGLESNTPVVVMKGSGRAADVICGVVEAPDEKYESIIGANIENYKDEWGLKDDDMKTNLKNNLRIFHDYFKNQKMVHLFNMRDFNNDLDTAIIKAAFSRKTDEKELNDEKKLDLAVTFNRVDFAEKYILNIQDINLNEYMKRALMKNLWKFVDFFLGQGLTVKSFLTAKILVDLYFKTESYENLNIGIKAILFEREKLIDGQKLSSIGKILGKLTNDLFPKMYRDNEIKDRVETKCNIINAMTEVSPEEKIEKMTFYPPTNGNGRIYTEQDLFIWSLLTYRIEIAKIFWKHGKDHIGSALIASIILKAFQKKAEDRGEMELMNNLKIYQEEFENMAIKTLSEAYRRDQIRAHFLLIRALPYWGRESCLDIANKHQIINFLYHSACQTRLNSIWLGRILPYVNIFRILINIPFGFLTSKLFIFTTEFRNKKTPSENDNNRTDTHENHIAATNVSNSYMSSDNTKEELPLTKNTKTNNKSTRKEYDEVNEGKYLTEFRKQEQISIHDITFLKSVKYFYNAPITKFIMNIVSYMAFLTAFSYVLIIELNTLTLSPLPVQRQVEYVVYVFYLSFVIGEIRDFTMGGQSNTFKSKFNNWKSSHWKWLDLFIYVTFAIAFILRMTVKDSDFVYCRTLFAISLSLFFVRFMEFYYVHQSVGPKVIMISRMMKDIMFFLAIYILSLLAYGTFSLSLLYPNLTLNNTLVKNIIYNPYWQLYGQIDLTYMEGGTPCSNGLCPTPNTMVIIANAIFLLFANVLLLSLLIAMFGVTFTKVEENSKRVWAFTRYRMIEEFYYKPILPPPFNIFEIIFHLLKMLQCCGRPNAQLSKDEFIANLCHDEDVESSAFERQCMESYLEKNPLFSNAINENKSLMNSALENRWSTSNYEVNNDDISKNNSRANQSLDYDTQLVNMSNSLNKLQDEIANVLERVQKIRKYQKRHSTTKQSELTE